MIRRLCFWIRLSWIAICILVLCMDLPCVLADGMGFPQSIGVDVDTDFSEDLQLVFMEVNETHQRTELFVAVKPLGKESYNITLAVPMLYAPLDVDGGMMETETFRSSYGLAEAEHKSRRRNLTLGLSNTASYLNFFQQRTPLHLLLPLSSLITLNDVARGYYYGHRGGMGTWGTPGLTGRLEGVEHIESYRFEGVSMDVYRFDDYSSLKGLLESLGLGIPDSAREEVEKYDAHYVSALTMRLMPPVDQEVLDVLEADCPNTLAEFFELLPTVDEYLNEYIDRLKKDRPLYDIDPVRWASRRFAGMAIRELAATSDWNDKTQVVRVEQEILVWDSMADLVESYLSFPEKGYRIGFTNAHSGGIWYPLGTSSSWSHPVGLTEILVRLKGTLWIGDSEPEPVASFTTSSGRTFYWRMEKANPSVDLSANLSKRTFPGSVLRNTLAVILTGWYKPISFGLNLSTYFLAWLAAILVGFAAIPMAMPRRGLVGMAAILSLVTFFVSLIPLIFAYPLLYLRGKKTRAEDVKRSVWSGHLDTLVLLIATWGVFAGLVLILSMIHGSPFVVFFFLIASGIWFLLVALVLAGPRFEWAGGSLSAKRWGLSLVLAFTILIFYSASLLIGLALITTCFLGVALRWRILLSTS